MTPDELTDEQMATLIKRAWAIDIRVLCTEDQADAIKDAFSNAAKDAVFTVHHEGSEPSETDIEEAINFPYDVKWGKLGEP